MKQTLTENSRVTYKGKRGTLVAIGLHGCGYFNPDTNQRGNDGMILVLLEELTVPTSNETEVK